jgi:hypothetical protein
MQDTYLQSTAGVQILKSRACRTVVVGLDGHATVAPG